MPIRARIILCIIGSVLLMGGLAWGWSHWSVAGAVDALDADHPTDEQIEWIAGLLSDQTGQYRGRATEKLRQLGTRAVPALTKLSTNGDEDVRLTAAKLAAEIDPEGEGFTGLESILHDENVALRRGAANVLHSFIKGGEMSDYPQSYKLLLTAEEDPDPVVRERVVVGLGHLHVKEAEAALQRLAQDENRDVARAAQRRLAKSYGGHRGKRE